MKAPAFLLLALLPLASSAAEDSYFYIGGSAGPIKFVDVCGERAVACEDNDTAWKVYAGRRFGRHFALEIHYADLGSGSSSTAFSTGSGGFTSVSGFRSKAIGVSARGIAPLEASRFSLFGKIGLQYLQRDQVRPVPRDQSADDTIGPLAGLGAEWAVVRNLALRGEAEFLGVINAALFSIGLQLRW